MSAFLYLIAVTVAVVVVSSFWWRHASRRRLLPCPPWLIWLLENPYMKAVASSSLLVDRLDLSPGMRVLDAGCGPGRLSIPAAKAVGPDGHVTALDVQPAMLQRVQARAEASGTKNIRTLQAGLGAGKTEPNSFDRALLVTVLGEIPEEDKALAEIFNALKPNGILSITEVIPDPHYRSHRSVRQLAAAAGFQLANEYGNWFAFTCNFVKPSVA